MHKYIRYCRLLLHNTAAQLQNRGASYNAGAILMQVGARAIVRSTGTILIQAGAKRFVL